MKAVKFNIKEPSTFIPEAAAEHSITIQELINVLQSFPPDAKIICSLGNATYNLPFCEIDKEDFRFDIL